jgi:hypothetical protein
MKGILFEHERGIRTHREVYLGYWGKEVVRVSSRTLLSICDQIAFLKEVTPVT